MTAINANPIVRPSSIHPAFVPSDSALCLLRSCQVAPPVNLLFAPGSGRASLISPIAARRQIVCNSASGVLRDRGDRICRKASNLVEPLLKARPVKRSSRHTPRAVRHGSTDPPRASDLHASSRPASRNRYTVQFPSQNPVSRSAPAGFRRPTVQSGEDPHASPLQPMALWTALRTSFIEPVPTRSSRDLPAAPKPKRNSPNGPRNGCTVM